MDDPLKQCEAMLAKFAAEQEKKFAALLSVVEELKGKNPTTELAALTTKLTELSAKVDESAKNALTVESVAKEFTKVVGTSPATGASLSAGGKTDEKKLDQVGEELVQKHFAATKSKQKAFQLAGAENGKAVEALIKTGRAINYVAKAA